jgi:hypothetical protein
MQLGRSVTILLALYQYRPLLCHGSLWTFTMGSLHLLGGRRGRTDDLRGSQAVYFAKFWRQRVPRQGSVGRLGCDQPPNVSFPLAAIADLDGGTGRKPIVIVASAISLPASIY